MTEHAIPYMWNLSAVVDYAILSKTETSPLFTLLTEKEYEFKVR